MVNKQDFNDISSFDYTTTSIDSLATVGSTRHLLGNTSNIKLYSNTTHNVSGKRRESQNVSLRNGTSSHRPVAVAALSPTPLQQLQQKTNGSAAHQKQKPDYCLHGGGIHGLHGIHDPRGSISYTESSVFSDEMCMQIQEKRSTNPSTSKGNAITHFCHACKNLIVLSLSFMLLFTAFISLQTLQSSLHGHIGVISLSCYYGATLLSCFIAPAIVTKLSTKWTICVGAFFYLVHIASHFHPRLYILIPSSLLLGAMNGPMWSAQSTYLTTLAISYAQASGQVMEVAISSFNGIFFGFLQTSQVWGNLLSASVLGADNTTVLLNQMNESLLKYACGSQDCGLWDQFPSNALPHQLSPVSPFSTHILLAVYIVLVLLSLLLSTLLLSKTAIHSSGSMRSISLSSQQLLFTSARMFTDHRLQLLIPLVVFTGLEQGFVLGDFTKSYVNCALGIHKIGYVMVCFGAVNAACCVLIGNVVKHIKRHPIMISGTLFSCGLFTVLIWWRPNAEDPAMFYVIASCLGLCDAIWQTQTNAMFGIIFKDQPEAAFSCYRMLQCFGFSMAFGLGAVLCVRTKVYIMCGVLGVAILAYGVVERQLIIKRKNTANVVML